MDSRSIGADLSFAWPANEIAVMGAEAAVGVIHHKKLADTGSLPRNRLELTKDDRARGIEVA